MTNSLLLVLVGAWPAAMATDVAAQGRQGLQAPPIAERPTQATWRRSPIPGALRDNGFTHALAVGDTVWFLQGRDVYERDGVGAWRYHEQVLPAPVGSFSAATVGRDGRLLVVPGGGHAGFRTDPRSWQVELIPALDQPTDRGCVVCVDEDDIPYLILGGRLPTWGRVVNGQWQELSDIVTVTPVGGYSAGLFAMPGRFLVAFGDHHVNVYRPEAGKWDAKSKLFVQLGFRPALDRGGMCVQDPTSGQVFMTLGKGSRSLGLMTTDRRFFHLRPRLPFLLSDPDRALYVTVSPQGSRLNLLSREQGALFSIPLLQLVPIGLIDQLADVGSRFEVSNSRFSGSMGDLARERDSVCSLVYCDPYVYIQRKMFVRRVHMQTLVHSPPDAGYRYGNEFAVEGAALCHDSEDGIYVYNGHSSRFWRLRPFTSNNGEKRRSDSQVPLADAMVTELSAIPEWRGTARRDGRGRNTPMVVHDGGVFAMFEPVTRRLWRYDIAANRWAAVAVLPAGVPYTREDGSQLCTDGERLWLVTKDRLIDYTPGSGWGKSSQLAFSFSQDGGMLAPDLDRGRIYVAIGGGTRHLGVIDLVDRRSRLLTDFFPDVVSVPGQRMFLVQAGETTWLYIFRGHDTAEYWRTVVSGDGELRAVD